MIEQQIQLLQFIVLLAKKSVKVLVFTKQNPAPARILSRGNTNKIKPLFKS